MCRIIAFAAWVLCASVSIAHAADKPPPAHAESPRIAFFDTSQGLQVSVRQVIPGEIVKALARQFGIRFHYAALPHKTINADCSVADWPALIDCLFGRPVDAVYRYGRDGASGSAMQTVVEVWLMPLGQDGSTGQQGLPDRKSDGSHTSPTHVAIGSDVAKRREAVPDQSDNQQALLAAVNDGNAAKRADAIRRLAFEQDLPPEKLRGIIQQTLNDADAGVRAQALEAMANAEGSEGLEPILLEMLQDKDPRVRSMVVEHADRFPDILNAALTDRNPEVSEFARLKLEAFFGGQAHHP